MNKLKLVLIFSALITLIACQSTGSRTSSLLDSKKVRVLTLGNIEIKDGEQYTFSSWVCKDYIRGGATIIEAGVIDGISDDKSASTKNSEINFLNSGFILLSGTDAGFFAEYSMDGINHRWDWEASTGNDYAVTISQDGIGNYYEFGNASLIEMFTGRTAKSKQAFKCSK